MVCVTASHTPHHTRVSPDREGRSQEGDEEECLRLQVRRLQHQISAGGQRGAEGGRGGRWPEDVCAEFNTKGACSFGQRCKFRHACGDCGGQHAAKACPSKQA